MGHSGVLHLLADPEAAGYKTEPEPKTPSLPNTYLRRDGYNVATSIFQHFITCSHTSGRDMQGVGCSLSLSIRLEMQINLAELRP